ncbi:MAG: hypothetical protein GY856_35190 [bacterium]|nr:hypothetical protein [bacterium]
MRKSSSCSIVGLTTILLHMASGAACPQCSTAAGEQFQVAEEVTNACAKSFDSDPIRRLHQRIQRLDRELQSRLIWVGRSAAAGLAAETGLTNEAARFRHNLEFLDREAHGLGPEIGAPLRAKLRALGNLVTNLERAAEAGPSSSALPAFDRRDPGPVIRTPTTAGTAPPNDDCANALAIGDGTVVGDTSGATNDGQATCGSSLYSRDVWFKYVAGDRGYVSADTLGSAYDTVLSVHMACPGTAANQITCDDDAYGLQSAVSFYAPAAGEYWIRVSGFDDAAGTFQLHVEAHGAISGTVTDAATGDPLAGGRVEARNAAGYFEGSGTTTASGEYTIAALDDGSYFLTTKSFAGSPGGGQMGGYIDELYDDLPCPGGGPYGCELTAGIPVPATAGTITTDIDFALDAGGAISGRVTRTATGDPIAGVRVKIYAGNGSFIDSEFTDASGEYSLPGLLAGIYFAATDSDSDFIDELYDDIPCPGGAPQGCHPRLGTPIAVGGTATTPDVDFALDRGGIVSGKVTEAATGKPIANIAVLIWDGEGSFVAYGLTDPSGDFSVGGLLTGTYFATAEDTDFLVELYDDLFCPGGGLFGCDPTTGTPIAVTVNEAAPGIDFALVRLGVISGTVTVAATGEPLSYVFVEIWDDEGIRVRHGYTDFSGDYAVPGLAAGTYFATTRNSFGFLDELYDGLPCPHGAPYGCDPTTGTPIAVIIDATTPGIDFALDRLGVISGTVTAAATGEPLSSFRVDIWDAAGSRVGLDHTDTAGYYTVEGLYSGIYFATTSNPSETSELVDELYDGIPCPGGPPFGCDPTTGTPIVVGDPGRGQPIVAGIDFALGVAGLLRDGFESGDLSCWASVVGAQHP